MTTGPADLVPLLTPPDPNAVGFRQGIVVAFNKSTGANTISVAGGLLTDLPMLNSLDALSMVPGDVVGLLTSGPSWFLLGRIATVGSPHLFQALSSLVTVSRDGASGTTNSATYTDLAGKAPSPAVTVNIGPSGRALCWFTLETSYNATVATGVQTWASVAVSGATTLAASDAWARQASQNPVNETAWFAMSTFHLFEGLTPGLNTFTMKYRTGSPGGGAQPTATFLEREIAVMAL